eukprot:457023_1
MSTTEHNTRIRRRFFSKCFCSNRNNCIINVMSVLRTPTKSSIRMKSITNLLLLDSSIEISHHMPPNYRQSSLQIQDLSYHHTRSTHGHHHS